MKDKNQHEDDFFMNRSRDNYEFASDIINYEKPKKNRFRIVKFLIPAIAVITFAYMYIENFLYAPSNYNGKIISIEKNASIHESAKILTKAKISKNSYLCKTIIYILSVFNKQISPGKYTFQRNISLIAAITNLYEKRLMNYKITFKEGLTSEEIVTIINLENKFSGDKITEIPDEGTLMPDTYFYTSANTRELIIKNMTNEMENFLKKEIQDKDPLCHLDTKEEIVNLASIIEKEASDPYERKLIAYILLKRLQKNTRLQVDAPFLYKNNIKRVLFKHLHEKGDYNTYRSKGLPKTPICNPSRESILAVLHPIKNDYLFYIATGKGTHFFSKTFEEHVQYRKKIQARKALIK